GVLSTASLPTRPKHQPDAVRLRSLDCGTAAHFANAATVFPPNSPYEGKRVSYLQKEASALYQQGYELGDNGPLEERSAILGALTASIQRRNCVVERIRRERKAADAPRPQENLGVALGPLGASEGDPAGLGEAVAAFRDALKERTRERVPLEWAMTQNNLGT